MPQNQLPRNHILVLLIGCTFLLWISFLLLSVYHSGKVKLLSKKLEQLSLTVDSHRQENSGLKLKFYTRLKEENIVPTTTTTNEGSYKKVSVRQIPIVRFHF